MKAIGTNTASVANVPASTAKATRLVAVWAASVASPPSSTSFWTASTTTMASSTNRPIATVSASNVTMLTVKSKAAKATKVATIEVGIASSTMTVARQLRRNRKVTATTSTTAMKRSNSTSPMACSIKRDVSRAMMKLTPSGAVVRMLSISARICSATATVFSPLCLRTSRTTPGSPSSWA